MEDTATATMPTPSAKPAQKIPDALVYEMAGGKPIYYKGYRDVLNKTSNLESVMAESSLQIWLKTRLANLLLALLEPKGYEVVNGELGLLLGNGKSRGADVAIYRSEDFPLSGKFLSNPPEIIIEVDIQADLEDQTELDYIIEKIEDYLRFGVKKVIWIFTSARKIMLAEPGQPWLTVNWDTTIETLEGASFNLDEMLKGRRVG